MNELQDWLTIEEVAGILGVSGRWVRHLCDVGDLTAVKRGSRWLVHRDSVQDYKQRQEKE